jgi:resolvase-like protein
MPCVPLDVKKSTWRQRAGRVPNGQNLPSYYAISGLAMSLVIWKLDRLGRSLGHLVELVNLLMDKKIGFQSLHEVELGCL